MKTSDSTSPEVVAPQHQSLPVAPAAEPTLQDDWAATAQIATLAPSTPATPAPNTPITVAPAAATGFNPLRLIAKWTAVTAVCAAVIWPIVDAHTNYCFKTVPQYLEQEWVWWVKTTR